ncbi:hypothetical protein C8R43DRAFT_662855 [Mycena crocata]|nr:hypothetical protein C8R43DRAFT_662855 [Mycena crocata]
MAEAFALATSVIAVIQAAKEAAELIIKVKNAFKQVKRNRKDRANQLEQLLQLLDEVQTACKGIKIEGEALTAATNKLKSNLERFLNYNREMKNPSGFLKAFLERNSIKKMIEEVNAGVRDFLMFFNTCANIRIERTASDNSDKLDQLLSMERNRPSPTHAQSLNCSHHSMGSSRKIKEYLIGQLHKLSQSLEGKQPSTQTAPIYPDRLTSNTHRPSVSEATYGLHDAIAKTEAILSTYSTDSAAESAHSLDNLSVALMDVGLAHQASEISSFSVRLYGNSQADGNFAIALHNHSHHLNASHRFNEAVMQAEHAVEIYRGLPNALLDPGRAKALENFAACLFAVGKREDALDISDEAVKLSRSLLRRKRNDDCLSADLAMLLSNRASRLQALKYDKDALNDAHESQEMYHRLYQQHLQSDRYTAEYADSLRVYSEILFVQGSGEALDSARKAVDLWVELHAINADVYRLKLARGLIGLFKILRSLGRHIEAKDEICKANGIFRDLARKSPELSPEYAESFHSIAEAFMDKNRHKEALPSLDEAISIYAALVPGTRDAELAAVYSDKHFCLVQLKRYAEAAEASRLTITILKQAAPSTKNQEALASARRNLASALYNLSNLPTTSPASAIGFALEAVELFRSLLQEVRDDTTVRRKLAMASRSLSFFYSDLEKHAQALQFAKLSVRSLKHQAKENADRKLLRDAWKRVSACYHSTGDQERSEYAENQVAKLGCQ